MLRAALTTLCTLLLFVFVADDATAQARIVQAVTRVACVGDSITEGTANADHEWNSWPRILGRLLEHSSPGRFEIGNFGKSGATLLKEGSRPYWNERVFERSLAFRPTIVIINLGTNDARNSNWQKHGEKFEAELRELISRYQALESKPTIWLSNLTPMHEPHRRVRECAPNRLEIEKIIRAVAVDLGLDLIDFASETRGHADLFPDGVHPNSAGNALMAKAAFEALCDRTAPVDSSLLPAEVKGEKTSIVEQKKPGAILPGDWRETEFGIESSGRARFMQAALTIPDGDFHLHAALRMQGQKNSAAGFFINKNFFGFEGARGTVFRSGPQMKGLRLLHPSEYLWEREAWIDFEVIRNGKMVWFIIDGRIIDMAAIEGPIRRFGFDPMRSRMQISDWTVIGSVAALEPDFMRSRSLRVPWIDLSRRDDLRSTPAQGKSGASSDRDDRLVVFSDKSSKDEAVQRLKFLKGEETAAVVSPVAKESWSAPIALPAVLQGKDHRGILLRDGRLMVTYVDGHIDSPTRGDLVAWIGSLDVLKGRSEGDLTCRLVRGQESRGAVRNLSLRESGGGVIELVAGLETIEGIHEVAMKFSLEDLEQLRPQRKPRIPLVDLDQDPNRHVVVDRDSKQYLGHVSTVLLEDDKTILAVYPEGHGKGAIVYKKSEDGGRTWSDRLPTPKNWATSREVPTIHRTIDPKTGAKRLIMWSGLRPARLATSEDDGRNWSEIEPVGTWGGIVVMGFVERLKDGSYLAMFHDDGRFFDAKKKPKKPTVFTLYKTLSRDGGRTWSQPEVVLEDARIHPCEPGCIRSPDGKTLAVLLRENSRRQNSMVIFSEDEGRTWSPMRELPADLTGDRHTPKYTPDGRLVISFRDMALESETRGDWMVWVGTWDDIVQGKPGQYRIRVKDNRNSWDSTYPGVEVLKDGTVVTTTYGHWTDGEPPYILCARFKLGELDRRVSSSPR